MAQTFDINMTEVIGFTNKLGKLHKSALPLAIRSTLNDASFETKKVIPLFFAKQFTVRKKNFIRSHTGVNKSKNTFNVNQMVAKVGLIKGRSDSGDDLIKQEYGGTIQNRDFIPFKDARVGKNERKIISLEKQL